MAIYDRVLVPLDGSPLAEQVLPYAARIGQGLGTPIELFRVFGPVPAEMADPQRGLYVDRLSAGFRDEAINYLERVRSTLADIKVGVTCNALEGEAASQILNEADGPANTLIAMATHGRSGLSRWVMGSVTDKVLHGSAAAHLIVRAVPEDEKPTDFALNTIIVPVDGSALAEQVLPHVVALAVGLDLKVVVLRCFITMEGFAAFSGFDGVSSQQADAYGRMAEEATANATGYLNEIAERLRGQGVKDVESQLQHGPPALVIAEVAQKTPDNLVAMTTHGRSGLSRWTMGSVADRVVRHSGDPVLLVRAK